MEGFAESDSRELLATGETVSKRHRDTPSPTSTAPGGQNRQLARGTGITNQEIRRSSCSSAHIQSSGTWQRVHQTGITYRKELR